jgi:translation initiation factor IF-2
MAKLRVYELARDLNMTNKVLIAKLNDLDIEVKSHMSALEDEVISKIKSSLFGAKEETVEETRIKPTVIRRRRRTVKVEAVETPEEETQEAEAAATEADAVADEAEQKAAPEEVADEVTEPPADAEPEKAEEPVAEEEPTAPEAPKPPKARKKEPSAKIIKLPVKPPRKPLKEKKVAPQKAKVEPLPSRKALEEQPAREDDVSPSAKKKENTRKSMRNQKSIRSS